MENFMTGNIEGIFSVAVAAFLLVRMEKRLEKLSETLTELTIAVRKLGTENEK